MNTPQTQNRSLFLTRTSGFQMRGNSTHSQIFLRAVGGLLIFSLGYLTRGQIEQSTVYPPRPASTQIDSSPLASVGRQALILTYSDEECGEWGGNTETINIKREHHDSPLTATYKFEKIDCADPYNQFHEPDITISHTVLLTEEQEALALQLMLDLIELKLSNTRMMSHAGKINSAVLLDSSLIIHDYPSADIPSFEALKQSMLDSPEK